MLLLGCPVPAENALAKEGKFWYVGIITCITELSSVYIHLMIINEKLISYFTNITFKNIIFFLFA